MCGFQFYDNGEPLHPLSVEDVLELVKLGTLVPPTSKTVIYFRKASPLFSCPWAASVIVSDGFSTSSPFHSAAKETFHEQGVVTFGRIRHAKLALHLSIVFFVLLRVFHLSTFITRQKCYLMT